MTAREALETATAVLSAAGCETPRLDAEVLLASLLGVDRTALFLSPEVEAPPGFPAWVQRRARREPVAYITGRRWFRRLELRVDPRVLIPRPETEHLVEAALDLPRGARVVDVGTGSGAIALALKDERPDLELWGTDVSADALVVARENGERLDLDVRWRVGDLLDPAPAAVDAVLSNPPYVADADELPPEVAGFEPPAALRAGADGLDVYRRLVPQIAGRGAAFCALEVGEGQSAEVAALLRAAGCASAESIRDLAGVERVVVARW